LACGYFEAFAARHLLKMSNHNEQKQEALDGARVSHQTVSWVLKASPSVRDSTRQRVQDAMELRYRPNVASRAMIDRRSRDPSLVRCDDIPEAEHFDPPLTTMRPGNRAHSAPIRSFDKLRTRGTSSGHGQS
jgi:hypothetical protein